ncbi:divalent metal cation transporter [Kineobactrum salinum]|uniref:Divalent metal cation transporter n=2 Tax=Kineobactrum salinum TaxID=2708301 RepID=A0A6C0U5N4_9GAMM|nr:divalent metal cation transporter [Kineobactrum salinum]
MGAGAVASFLLAGAWFRYDLLWVVLVMLPVFVVSVDTASRIGACNPSEGMFALIRKRITPALAWALLLINVPVHLLIVMGQLSVMSSVVAATFGLPAPGSDAGGALLTDMVLSLAIAGAILWLVFSRGFDRMQNVMTVMMVLMFFCFLLVALRGFSEWRDILAGLVPAIPPDLAVPDTQTSRSTFVSITAMVGSAIAPAALLGMPYLAADSGVDPSGLKNAFRRAVVNLGLIFGAYAMFVVIAGGFALYPLVHHASLADVSEASRVLHGVFPERLAFLGPVVFSLGLFMAALTTLVVAAQVTAYFMLDTVGRQWRFASNNRSYHIIVAILVLGAAVLAPHWSFPALLKVVLLMGINVLVIPLVFVILLYLANSRDVMHDVRTEWWRNLILVVGLFLSLLLAAQKIPDYMAALFS